MKVVRDTTSKTLTNKKGSSEPFFLDNIENHAILIK